MFTLLTLCILLGLGYWVGGARNQRHLADLTAREAKMRGFPTTTAGSLPGSPAMSDAQLVTGTVVISIDHFKRFLARFRMILGGRLRAYESLLERARREALLRMQEEAQRVGADAILNVRLETSNIASSRANNKGTSGVEMLAYGTAVRTR
jgi:uncharacterized protein YbjQ (UPF0145 family)